MFNRLLSSLLFRVVLAIGIGTLLGTFVPESLNRIFITFNALFVQFLDFAVPLIIMGLIMPAIADLGKGAGKLLLLTTAIAYGSTLFSGFGTYAIGSWAFPAMLRDEIGAMPPVEGEQLLPYFTISIPSILDVMSALVLAFIVGLGLAHQQASALANVVRDFRKIILQLIENVIVPLLPLFIMGIFAEMAFSGRVFGIMAIFLQIVGVIFLLHIALLVIQFVVAGAIAGRNPWRLLVTMLPAYFTALGTQSSAATIPVTLIQTEKNGVSPQIAGFVIPLCATIHLSGSMMKITACALALMLVEGMDTGLNVYVGFIPMLGIAMVAAPGVPGGAIMAAVGMLQLMLGFNEEMIGLMIALYIAMDSFGTACNVTGDGAIAVVVNRIAKQAT